MKRSALLILLSISICFAATSVTQYGITWTFDADYEIGQYANGDYWVIGPVTISSITPESSGGRNGSVVDPPATKTQAWDDRLYYYEASHLANLPLTLQAGQCIVTVESDSTPPTGAYFAPLQTAAVLTCVSSNMGNGTHFRPHFAGSSPKNSYAVADLNLNILPAVSIPNSTPNISAYEAKFQRIWLDHFSSWTGRQLHPQDNMDNYGREIGNTSQTGGLLLTTDAVSNQLIYNYVQTGIDLYGQMINGSTWNSDGGHMNGRKLPIVLAGMLLNDSAMMSPGNSFGEDGHTYYGTGGIVLFGKDCVSPYQDAGCSGSGAKDCKDPDELIDACDDYRICCTSPTWVGAALATHMVNGKANWNHDAFFDYVDRWIDDGSGAGGDDADFINEMWTVYRDSTLSANIESGFIRSNSTSISASPNPFNPSTTISLKGFNSPVNLRIYNASGKCVKASNNIAKQSIVWNAANLSSGIYFIKATSKNTSVSTKIFLMK